jgi:hypothetical protein
MPVINSAPKITRRALTQQHRRAIILNLYQQQHTTKYPLSHYQARHLAAAAAVTVSPRSLAIGFYTALAWRKAIGSAAATVSKSHNGELFNNFRWALLPDGLCAEHARPHVIIQRLFNIALAAGQARSLPWTVIVKCLLLCQSHINILL